MRSSLTCSALASLALAASAQELPPLDIWPAAAPVPGEDGFVCGPEALIETKGPFANDRRYYNVSRPTLTPFLVQNGTGAAVMIAPGGGYSELNWDDEGTRVAAKMNAGGVSALLLKYRVPQRPTAPGALWAAAQTMDAQRAMGVARANAGAWGLNASRLGFMGFSAGGHLTARISTNWESRLYARVDASDDLPCRPDFALLQYPWKLLANDFINSTSLAPELVVNSSHPPASFAINMDDTTAHPENVLVYAHQLHVAGAPHPAVHLYPKGGHGFGVCAELDPVGGFEMCCEWPSHALRFLQSLGFAPGWPSNITRGGGI